jgi:hypothetical protein
VLALAALMTAGGAALAGPAQAQGLFDVLFGRREAYAPQPQYAPQPYFRQGADPRYQPRYRQTSRAAPIPERKRVVREQPAGPRTYTPPEVLAGPLGRFLADPTLRRGDVVATPIGLMVYRGDGGSRHKASDFVALSAGSKFVGGKSSDLAALDRLLKMHNDKPAPTSRLASAEAPIVAQDDTSAKRKRR